MIVTLLYPSSPLFPYTTLLRSLGMAHAYIDAVGRAGVDAVKFQTHIAACESSPSEPWRAPPRSEEHTSELQSLRHLVCRLLLEKKNIFSTLVSTSKRHVTVLIH